MRGWSSGYQKSVRRMSTAGPSEFVDDDEFGAGFSGSGQ
jgi:hypothetical protein